MEEDAYHKIDKNMIGKICSANHIFDAIYENPIKTILRSFQSQKKGSGPVGHQYSPVSKYMTFFLLL
jgi:hypothetical protein